MVNGELKTQALLIEMAIKQGTATVLAGLLLWAFWAVVIQPGADERKHYSETITTTSKENAASVKEQSKILSSIRDAVEDNTGTNHEIRNSVIIQQKTLEGIQDEVTKQSELRTTAMETMTAFADEVRCEHPEQLRKLNEILDAVKPQE